MKCPINPGRSTVVRAKARDTTRLGVIKRSHHGRLNLLRSRRTEANNEIVGSGLGNALARVLSQCRNQPIAVVDNDLVAVTDFPAVSDGFHG